MTTCLVISFIDILFKKIKKIIRFIHNRYKNHAHCLSDSLPTSSTDTQTFKSWGSENPLYSTSTLYMWDEIMLLMRRKKIVRKKTLVVGGITLHVSH